MRQVLHDFEGGILIPALQADAISASSPAKLQSADSVKLDCANREFGLRMYRQKYTLGVGVGDGGHVPPPQIRENIFRTIIMQNSVISRTNIM